jgi:hypothetical protein
MAYLGRQPVIGNFVKLDAITAVNGQAAYTMQNGGSNFTDYESVNQFLVSLNGTIQAPTDSFTVSGSTLTFASNLSTGDVIDFIIVFGNSLSAGTPTDGTVTAAKLNDDIISGQTALASEPADTDEFLVSDAGTLKRIDYSLIKGGGITEADMFRLTADRTGDGDLTANFERVDDASFAKIGTGMTESSGIFSFPSTGLYHVMTHSNFEPNSSGDNCKMNIKGTTDNSSYDDLAAASVGNIAKENTTTISTYINVTDVSNVKVKFTLSSMTGTSHIKGNSVYNRSCFVFIRLGDSQ